MQLRNTNHMDIFNIHVASALFCTFEQFMPNVYKIHIKNSYQHCHGTFRKIIVDLIFLSRKTRSHCQDCFSSDDDGVVVDNL